MRGLSRNMPPRDGGPLDAVMGWGCMSIFVVGVYGVLVYPWPLTRQFLCIGSILIIGYFSTVIRRRRMKRLAAGRPGESICTFARSFKWRTIDTWIIRALYEELQTLCQTGCEPFPVRATDRLFEDLRIYPDVVED